MKYLLSLLHYFNKCLFSDFIGHSTLLELAKEFGHVTPQSELGGAGLGTRLGEAGCEAVTLVVAIVTADSPTCTVNRASCLVIWLQVRKWQKAVFLEHKDM